MSPILALKLPDSLGLPPVVIVCSGKMVFIPFHLTVRPSSTFEIEPSPNLDLFRLAYDFRTIYNIISLRLYALR